MLCWRNNVHHKQMHKSEKQTNLGIGVLSKKENKYSEHLHTMLLRSDSLPPLGLVVRQGVDRWTGAPVDRWCAQVTIS